MMLAELFASPQSYLWKSYIRIDILDGQISTLKRFGEEILNCLHNSDEEISTHADLLALT